MSAYLLCCLLASTASAEMPPLGGGEAALPASLPRIEEATSGAPVASEQIPAAFSLDFAAAGAASGAAVTAATTQTAGPAGPADPATPPLQRIQEPYSAGVFWRQAKSIPWRFGGAAAAITATGFGNWDWGSSKFTFNSEGWFEKDTASLGMDKLGHAYTAYVLTELFTDGINNASGQQRSSAYTGAILSMGLMTYIEVFDGFSKEHGFSYEDLVMDAAGALFSVARRTVPGLREKVDFRLLYTPSKSSFRSFSCFPAPHCDRDGETARSPVTDYVNQRYLLALKLAGFEQFRRSPFRLVELHGGYYARGFTAEEEERGDPLRRRLFVGIGLNVGELLFPGRPGKAGRAVKSALEYLQVPYTAVHTN